MFSECQSDPLYSQALLTLTDASKFLAQSQSRISFTGPTDTAEQGRSTRQPKQGPRGSYTQHGRPNQRQGYGPQANTGIGFGQFGFGGRPARQAPLFHSAVGELREGDEEEHEREVADYFALQRSRKHFVQGRLEDSSEVEDNEDQGPGTDSKGPHSHWGPQQAGIKSSWNGDMKPGPRTADTKATLPVQSRFEEGNLGETMRSVDLGQDEPPGDLTMDYEEARSIGPGGISQHANGAFGQKAARLPASHHPLPSESDAPSEMPPSIQPIASGHSYNDWFWAQLYAIALVSFFTSFILVWMHVAKPSKHPLGDTIYTVIQKSYYLLAVDTLVAVVVALVWLAALRSYARALVYSILVGIPLVLFAFTLYPFISSFHTTGAGSTIQDTVMRWFSAFPLVMGIMWIYGIYRSRQSFTRAVDLLEFAVKILAANPPLLAIGFGTLGAIVVWTWLWMGMFTRVFLGGQFTKNWYFIIDVGTWWLGAFYILVYLWTLNVVSGIQRATTAATVSQWYFHRLNVPAAPSTAVVRAALSHALTSSLGTICLSTMLALLIRLPVLLLPRRLTAVVGFFSMALLPNSVAVLTHPTTLTYAAIHSQPLTDSARAVSDFSFMHARNALGTRKARITRSSANPPHRLALLLLYATRLAASFGFGFGAWVHTAKALPMNGMQRTYTGSLYAYIVGLIAGAIGWAIIGAMEGVLTGIVDAVVVCWESEIRSSGEARYCREAEWLLGDSGEDGRRGEGYREGLLSDQERL